MQSSRSTQTFHDPRTHRHALGIVAGFLFGVLAGWKDICCAGADDSTL
jgi:hypothetical protein